MVFKNLCILVLWRKVASALEGLIRRLLEMVVFMYDNFWRSFFNWESLYKILEEELLMVTDAQFGFHLKDFTKIVRLLFGATSVNTCPISISLLSSFCTKWMFIDVRCCHPTSMKSALTYEFKISSVRLNLLMLAVKSSLRKIFDGDLLVRSLPTTLLQIFCKINLNSRVSAKSM